MALTAAERHDRRLATYRKYNVSRKGRARTAAFKERHGITHGWEPMRNATHHRREMP